MGPKSGVAASMGFGYVLYICFIFGGILGIGAIAFDALAKTFGNMSSGIGSLNFGINGMFVILFAMFFFSGLATISWRNKEQKYSKYFSKKYKYVFGRKTLVLFFSSIFISGIEVLANNYIIKNKIITDSALLFSIALIITTIIIVLISSGKEAKDNLHIVETLNYRFNNIKKENISKLEMFLKICNEIPKDLNEDFTESIKLQFKKDLEA